LIDFYIDTSIGGGVGDGGISPLIFIYCFYPRMQVAFRASAARHTRLDSLTPAKEESIWKKNPDEMMMIHTRADVSAAICLL
jgi:hypothetical protein